MTAFAGSYLRRMLTIPPRDACRRRWRRMTSANQSRSTSTPVPMSALSAQLFRLAKSARGADADALEVYKI